MARKGDEGNFTLIGGPAPVRGQRPPVVQPTPEPAPAPLPTTAPVSDTRPKPAQTAPPQVASPPQSAADPLIRAVDLGKQYGSGETAVHALKSFSLAVQPGEFVAIMGPSGCGKSTLLNLLGALDQPSTGEVWVAGENLARLKDVDRFRARTIGFVFQLHNLLPTLTAQENVEVPMIGQEPSAAVRSRWARELLELVGLEGRAGHLPSQLSGGQRQRVAVARALANRPALLLADEPTGALDSQSGEEIMALLGQLNRTQGTTIAVVTHDRRVAQATQRILLMRDGYLVDDHRVGDPMEEDLRMLANSRLGQAILNDGDAPLSQMSPEEERLLRALLQRTRQADSA
jgi:ABC-type lipoprotein export system ATPase subunit